MTIDYQDLQENPRHRRFWTHGRCWLRRRGKWYERRCGTLEIEWSIPSGSSWGWGVTFGGGDSGSDLDARFTVPWLLSLYLSLGNVFRLYRFGTDFDRGHDRDISLRVFDGAIWWSVWVGSMASWSRDYPWCRWWRQGSFHFATLLGPQRYSCETIKANIPVRIPMAEGVYVGTAKIEQQIWKRPLWFATRRVSTWIDVPNGIPFAGKGENSWDCGDDGLFGCGVEGESVEQAIGHFIASVLTSRRRYGMPSADAITHAVTEAR
jgi:hypothetical protein